MQNVDSDVTQEHFDRRLRQIHSDTNYNNKFEEAADYYREKGYTVLNPAMLPEGMLPADYMRICFAMIDTANTVAFLPDYQHSAGAEIEHAYCRYTDKNIRYYASEKI